MKQWNSNGGTAVMVEQCCGKVEQSRWNSVVEQWNSGTLMVEHCNETVEQQWWNSSHGGTVLWKSGTVKVEQCGGTVEQWNIDGGTL